MAIEEKKRTGNHAKVIQSERVRAMEEASFIEIKLKTLLESLQLNQQENLTSVIRNSLDDLKNQLDICKKAQSELMIIIDLERVNDEINLVWEAPKDIHRDSTRCY